MQALAIKLLTGRFAICRLPATAPIPALVFGLRWYAITKTAAELSLVLPEEAGIIGERREPGWRCLEMQGPFALDVVGVLAAVTAVLAKAGVSVFAISTFDTDYLLVKDIDLALAVRALRADGYIVAGDLSSRGDAS